MHSLIFTLSIHQCESFDWVLWSFEQYKVLYPRDTKMAKCVESSTFSWHHVLAILPKFVWQIDYMPLGVLIASCIPVHSFLIVSCEWSFFASLRSISFLLSASWCLNNMFIYFSSRGTWRLHLATISVQEHLFLGVLGNLLWILAQTDEMMLSERG